MIEAQEEGWIRASRCSRSIKAECDRLEYDLIKYPV
jgi:hypothetical protein